MIQDKKQTVKVTILKNRQTGEIVTSDMLFLNDYSDSGSASLYATVSAIERDWETIGVKESD